MSLALFGVAWLIHRWLLPDVLYKQGMIMASCMEPSTLWNKLEGVQHGDESYFLYSCDLSVWVTRLWISKAKTNGKNNAFLCQVSSFRRSFVAYAHSRKIPVIFFTNTNFLFSRSWLGHHHGPSLFLNRETFSSVITRDGHLSGYLTPVPNHYFFKPFWCLNGAQNCT